VFISVARKIKPREPLAKAPTGIAGLDEITGGRWPRGRAAPMVLQSLTNDAVLFNVLLHAERALVEDVRLTPTLKRLLPEPVRRIIGTLADTRLLLQPFGIPVPVP
jgi:hypothetical protein